MSTKKDKSSKKGASKSKLSKKSKSSKKGSKVKASSTSVAKSASKTQADGKSTSSKSQKSEKTKDKLSKMATTAKSAAKSGTKSKQTVTGASAPPVTEETINKNRAVLEKIIELLQSVKPDQVTRNNKDDLDKIQTLIKNIQYRDAGEMSRVREVVLSDQQKAVIKLVCGVCDDDAGPDMTMTITKDVPTGGPGNAAGAPKINYPYQQLSLAPTKIPKAKG